MSPEISMFLMMPAGTNKNNDKDQPIKFGSHTANYDEASRERNKKNRSGNYKNDVVISSYKLASVKTEKKLCFRAFVLQNT